MKFGKLILLCTAILLLMLASCTASQGPEGPVGPAGPAGPPGPQGPAGDPAFASQSYVGSDQCGSCHESQYSSFSLSGHPHQLTKITEGEAPQLPYDDITGGVEEPPDGYTWNDISYVIGGFGWKAHFIDQQGYIITGDESAATQYNYANEDVGTEAGWVPYHAGEQLTYNCGSCHTTGFNPVGHQDGLEGITGTWALPGIQCEECHGPGSRHANDPYGVNMVLDRTSQLCGRCHHRDDPAEIEVSDGFVSHYQQFNEQFSSKHFAITCVTCHDPHASTKFADEELNPNNGIQQSCDSCHWQQRFQNNQLHQGVGVECTDCHMPPMDRSAVGDIDTWTADLPSHLFSINPSADAAQFNEDGDRSQPYLSLSYACMHCHNGQKASEKDLETLSDMATGYHSPPTPTPEPTLEPTVEPSSELTPTPSS